MSFIVNIEEKGSTFKSVHVLYLSGCGIDTEPWTLGKSFAYGIA